MENNNNLEMSIQNRRDMALLIKMSGEMAKLAKKYLEILHEIMTHLCESREVSFLYFPY